jgi:hypothetical protein
VTYQLGTHTPDYQQFDQVNYGSDLGKYFVDGVTLSGSGKFKGSSEGSPLPDGYVTTYQEDLPTSTTQAQAGASARAELPADAVSVGTIATEPDCHGEEFSSTELGQILASTGVNAKYVFIYYGSGYGTPVPFDPTSVNTLFVGPGTGNVTADYGTFCNPPPPPTTTPTQPPPVGTPTTTTAPPSLNVSFSDGPAQLVSYIQGGYCHPQDNNGGACAVYETQGGTGTGAPGSIKAVTFWLCKSTVDFCDSTGDNAEAKANVIEFADPAASLAYLDGQKGTGTWLTGYQVNQWSVTIESEGISPSETTKMENAEYSGAAIMNEGGEPSNLHIVQVF